MDYRKLAEWVGLGGPRPSDADLADYLQADLENKDGEIDAVDYAVMREAIEALRSNGKLRTALTLAVSHIEHMAKWIAKQSAGYSFESLGEDMGSIKDAAGR